MTYERIRTAQFLLRENRFTAQVLLDGAPVRVHVKNTGRCAELLTPNATVYLAGAENPARKTAWDLVAVEKGPLLINMDSAAPNKAAGEWLAAGGLGELSALRAEYTVGDSRFDFHAMRGGAPLLVEVKGCTAEGWQCCVLVVIQMKGVRLFRPNWATQPAFGRALAEAQAAGVQLLAMDCRVTPDSMVLDAPVPIDLTPPKGV